MKLANNDITHGISSTLHLLDIGGMMSIFYDSSTDEKGIAIKVIAGGTLAKGEVLCFLQGGTTKRAYKAPTTGNSHDMPVGIALTAAANVGDSFWMCIQGIVKVLPNAAESFTMGYILTTSDTTAGRANNSATAPAAIDHFTELGHAIENSSGNGELTLSIIHFN